MTLVLVAKLLFHHEGLVGCKDTYSIDTITRVGAGLFRPRGGGSGPTIKARFFLVFNHVTIFILS